MRKRSAPKRSYGYSRKPMYKYKKKNLMVKPDGIIKEKINVIQDWKANSQISGNGTTQRANILWGSISGQDGAAIDNLFSIDKNNEQFKQQASNYRFYKPYMMTIRYVPRDQVPASDTQPLIRSIESASSPFNELDDAFS